MELDDLFAADSDFWPTDSGKVKKAERRIRFDEEAESFLQRMESEGFPISNLVNFCVKQCKPLYDNRGFTWKGFEQVKAQIRKPY